MANIKLGQDIQMKEEYIEELQMENIVKREKNDSNPWLIENAEEFLKYCCANCDFNSKDLQDFSNHVSANHFTSNLFFQGKVNKQVKRTIAKPFNFKKLEKGKCVVPNCTVVESFGFFKFPKEAEKHYSWLKLCGLPVVKENDRICANHFTESDFCVYVKRMAYPSLNLNIGERNPIFPTKNVNETNEDTIFPTPTKGIVMAEAHLAKQTGNFEYLL